MVLEILGLDEEKAKPFAESKSFPIGTCRSKILNLQNNEKNSRQEAAKTTISVNQHAEFNAQAEMDHSQINSIVESSRSLSAAYKAEADVRKRKWEALFETAKTAATAKAIADFKAEFGKKPSLDKTTLDKLNDMCK
jgi:hypothetical protein